jgi:hypothetical protein
MSRVVFRFMFLSFDHLHYLSNYHATKVMTATVADEYHITARYRKLETLLTT